MTVHFLSLICLNSKLFNKRPDGIRLGSRLFVLGSCLLLLHWQHQFTWASKWLLNYFCGTIFCGRHVPVSVTYKLVACHCFFRQCHVDIHAWYSKINFSINNSTAWIYSESCAVLPYFYYFHISIFIFSKNIFIVSLPHCRLLFLWTMQFTYTNH